MDRPLLEVPVGSTGPALAATLVGALRPALDGSGPAVLPVALPDGASSQPLAAPDGASSRRFDAASAQRPVTSAEPPATHVPEPVALVVRTSGSTGHARHVMLDRAALHASARATEQRLHGPGRWVLALPLGHVAGVQVLVRSLVAGTEPVVVDATGGFDPRRLAAAAAEAASGVSPAYCSLVPTQLHRIVAAAHGERRLPAALEPLTRLDAILLGGAATSPALLDRARDLGLAVVTTYGMTETCGGCVYDGRPLDGVRLDVDAGGVRIAGPVLARGYLGDGPADDAFVTDAYGVRWFRTRDLGHLHDGVLRLAGRSDDVIVTGGHKVAPAEVEAVLAGLRGVGQVCVVGVPDDEWGAAVTVVVVPDGRGGPPGLAELRDAVRRTLGSAAAPRHLVLADTLPERGPGKVDRTEVARRAHAALHASPASPSTWTEHHGHTR